MQATEGHTARQGDVFLAVGFGTTVLLWALCYLFRLPGLSLPSPVLGGVLIAALAAGGFWAGRHSSRGLQVGLLAGVTTAALNLMIIGSVSDAMAGGLQTSVPVVLAGVLLAGAAIGGAGGAVGARFRAPANPERWRAALPKVAPVATFLLIILGGVVTSADAGLAVYDWPTTFGSNMFLFPLSKMVGGVFYEHAHRLFGALVGLTTIAVAVHLSRRDRRGWVRGCGVAAVLLVVTQGILGAARVVKADVAPEVGDDTGFARWLAVLHGVGGQLIFGLLVAVAAFTSRSWQKLPGLQQASLVLDRWLAVCLVPLVVSQLLMGALLRQFGPYAKPTVDAGPGFGSSSWLTVHLVWAFVVVVYGLFVAARGRALYRSRPPIAGTAGWLAGLFLGQLFFGFSALVVTAGSAEQSAATGAAGGGTVWSVLVPTAHQALGAAILGTAILHAIWLLRAAANGAPRAGRGADPTEVARRPATV